MKAPMRNPPAMIAGPAEDAAPVFATGEVAADAGSENRHCVNQRPNTAYLGAGLGVLERRLGVPWV
jgi:hypothetical protein